MLLGHLQAFARVQQAHVAGLADHDGLGEREDAGERDVEIGQDADRRALDHELAKAVEVARPGAAGVDQGGGAGAPRHRLRAHAERGGAPVHVGVEVDQARAPPARPSAAMVSAARAGSMRRRDLGHLAVLERDVVAAVQALRRVDHPAAQDEQIVHCASRQTRFPGASVRLPQGRGPRPSCARGAGILRDVAWLQAAAPEAAGTSAAVRRGSGATGTAAAPSVCRRICQRRAACRGCGAAPPRFR